MVKDIIEQNEKIDTNSGVLEILREKFPGCFNNEGKFDMEVFSAMVKEKVTVTNEGYGINFLGKDYAQLLASLDTTTVIVPDTEHNSKPENVTSENVYISGDNLDALKHLLKSYSGKVKCIYIDPPYNTGSDGFVYNDNFNFNLEELQTRLGISEERAVRILDLTTRGAASHSAWLTFMLPRLELAKDLLSPYGVIFISIDDNEQANLKILCDYIFGEENMIANFIWKKRQMVDSRTTNGASKDHDYLLCYGTTNETRIQGKESDMSKYSNPDNDPRGSWMSADMTGLATESQRPNLHYELKNPATGVVYACPPTGWRYERSRMAELIANGEVIFPTSPTGRPRRKKFLKDLNSEYTGFSTVFDTVYSTQGTRELRELFDGKDYFDFPKPVDYIVQILQQGIHPSNNEPITVLDFFSGSATTAHAAMELMANGEDINFIMVQIPAEFPVLSDAYKDGYRTIDQLGIERIKRAAKLIKEKYPLFGKEIGFKHYTLAEPTDDTLAKMERFDPKDPIMSLGLNILEEFGAATVLQTWLMRDGYGFNAKVEEVKLGEYTAYQCGRHLYLIDEEFNENAMLELAHRYLTDKGFTPDVITMFGYSFNYSTTQMIEKNIAALSGTGNVRRITTDLRY